MIFKINLNKANKQKRFKKTYEPAYIEKCMHDVLEHLKNEGSKIQADVIKEMYDNVEKAKKVNDFLQGKKFKDKIIPHDEATAFLVYLGLTQASYTFIKKFLEDRNMYLLPTYDAIRPERKKCVADDLKATDDEIVASVKSTWYNYLGRLLKDPDVKEKVREIKKEHPTAEIQALGKGGWDGSTQKKHRVRVQIYNS